MIKYAIIYANRVKPEPLKGKLIECWKDGWTAKKEDINSAVEWALQKIKDNTKIHRTSAFPHGSWIKPNDVKKIILEAFEDAMK